MGHISKDLLIEYERRVRETVLAAHAENEPEDEDDDDELMEVDVDASEVEQAVPEKILAHTLLRQLRHHKNGGLWRARARVQYSDGPKTDGYVTSTFLGDSKEGLDLLRAYTKGNDGQTVLQVQYTCHGLKTV